MSSTNRGAVRRAYDDYQTPRWAVRALLEHVKVSGTILEPCAGTRNIITELELRPLMPARVDRCEILEDRDFLDISWFQSSGRFLPPYVWIITNPPYSLAREFIDRSLWLADNIALLLRLRLLESKVRLDSWQSRIPSALYVLASRPNFLDRQGNRVLNKQGKPGV